VDKDSNIKQWIVVLQNAVINVRCILHFVEGRVYDNSWTKSWIV
jgi:hypothetical protein